MLIFYALLFLLGVAVNTDLGLGDIILLVAWLALSRNTK